MKQFIYLVLSLIVANHNVKAQNTQLSKIDSLNIGRSKKLADEILNPKEGSTKYMVFAIGDDILFIYDSADVYNLRFVSEHFNYTTQQKEFGYRETKHVDINKQPLSSFWFRNKACSKPFVYTGNQNVPSHSNYMYFLMQNGANKICEFNMPVEENAGLSKGEKVPLNRKLLNYLLGELLPYVARKAAAKP